MGSNMPRSKSVVCWMKAARTRATASSPWPIRVSPAWSRRSRKRFFALRD